MVSPLYAGVNMKPDESLGNLDIFCSDATQNNTQDNQIPQYDWAKVTESKFSPWEHEDIETGPFVSHESLPPY